MRLLKLLKLLEASLPAIEQELKLLLLPKDPNDDRNILLEIRAGAGGDEASIFVADTWRMYKNYFVLQIILYLVLVVFFLLDDLLYIQNNQITGIFLIILLLDLVFLLFCRLYFW